MKYVKQFIQGAAIAATLAFIGAPAHAELIGTPLEGDSRLVQFQFDEDNTYLILTKPKAVTHLQFAPDELVMTTAAGDTAQWKIDVTKNRKNIFIKPTYEGHETSLTVLTDKRTYQFVLKSTAEHKKWYQRVGWLYPNSLVLEMDGAESAATGTGATGEPGVRPASASAGPQGIRPENIKFGYEVTGEAPFKPSTVFDDGKFTWIKMPTDVQELPALFAVIEDQQFSLVNYTVDGDYLVAQRLLTEAVLKLGKKEVRIVKKKPRTFLGMRLGDAE